MISLVILDVLVNFPLEREHIEKMHIERFIWMSSKIIPSTLWSYMLEHTRKVILSIIYVLL